MFQLNKKHSIQYTNSLLSGCDFLTHAFCTRLGGLSEDDYKSLNISFKEGDLESRVLQNWNRLAMAFAIPLENFLTLNQVHGDDIFIIKPYGDYLPSDGALNYDAIITPRENLAICVKTADCVPVFIVDRAKKSLRQSMPDGKAPRWKSAPKSFVFSWTNTDHIRTIFWRPLALRSDSAALKLMKTRRILFAIKKITKRFYSPAIDRINGSWIYRKPTADR